MMQKNISKVIKTVSSIGFLNKQSFQATKRFVRFFKLDLPLTLAHFYAIFLHSCHIQ